MQALSITTEEPELTVAKLDENYAVSIDVMLFGLPGVGCRALARQFVDGIFSGSVLLFPTRSNRVIDTGANDINVNIRFMQSFEWMIGKKAYWRGTVAMLVYNTNDHKSFEALHEFMRLIKIHCSANAIVAIVGTQSDIGNQILPSEIEELMSTNEKHKSFHFEVSAKTGRGIDNMFIYLANTIVSTTNLLDKNLMITFGKHQIRKHDLRAELWKERSHLCDTTIIS